MTSDQRMGPSEVAIGLRRIPGWTLKDEKIYREFVFKDFSRAFSFMSRVVEVVEQMNHHPEWLNIYNRVSVYLTTHDAGGITEKDFALAEKMNFIFDR